MASLPQSLAEWRDREGVGLDQLARALRVEAGTLERIETGEVAPGNELREKIGKTIERGFDHKISAAPGPLPAIERDGKDAATDGKPVAASISCPAFGAWLAKRDDRPWQIELLTPTGALESFSIASAFALAVKLNQLVAAHDAGPPGFAPAFP